MVVTASEPTIPTETVPPSVRQAVSGGAFGRPTTGSAGAGDLVPAASMRLWNRHRSRPLSTEVVPPLLHGDDVVDVAAVDRFVAAAVVLAVPVAGDDRVTQRAAEAASG